MWASTEPRLLKKHFCIYLQVLEPDQYRIFNIDTDILAT